MTIAQRPRRREPTLATVATLAGVSPATVSRVINGTSNVTPGVRESVEAAIEQLGYVPNRAARSLVTRRTDSIALVVREPVEFGFADPYLSSVVVAASQSLLGSGMQLVVMLAQNDEHHAQASSFVRAGHVDGVILVSVHEDDPLPGQLARARIPFVLGGRPSTPLPGATYVDVDNRLGARLATERLLATGHQRIATITGPPDMTASRDRLAGFRETLRDAGVRAAGVAHGRFTRESGVAAMGELLETEPDLDAVFAANDLMAVGALSALREAGRRVPDDVAVVGFDDIALAQDVEPALTTVHQPVAEEARLMTQEVLRQIRGEPAGEPVVLAPRLVVRASG